MINTRSRRGDRAAALLADALRRHGLELDLVARVHRPSRLKETLDTILDRGIDRLIVGGGDGTLGTVAARLAFRSILLGVIPLGTANDFARTLGIPFEMTAAAEVAAGSNVRSIDMAKANDIPFLNVAGLGLSVATTTLITQRLKRWFGPVAYALAGAMALTRHPTFVATIVTADGSTDRRCHQLIVGNGRFYGGGVLVAKGSTLEDGKLNVYTMGARGRLELLRTLTLLRLRVPLDRPGDDFAQCAEVSVSTLPRGLPVNLDGEIRTQTPVQFKVIPGALQVLVP